MPESRQVSTFYLNDLLFGIDVHAVQEIIRGQRLTRVPLAHPAIRGLINIRGQIVTVIDLKERVEIPRNGEADGACEGPNVVVRTETGPLSFQVDAIGDVVDVEDSTFEAPPDTVSPSVRDLLLGIHKLDGRILHLLSTDKLVNFRSQVPSTRDGASQERARVEQTT
jgi:purine-binding chemotaxis protein CheW